MNGKLLVLGFTLVACSSPAAEKALSQPLTRGDFALAGYFRRETAQLAERCLAEIKTREDWMAHREEYRRQLAEMLGLWPMPERTDLHPVITGKLEQDDFTVEKLHFQALPHLYVTANLYLPKNLAKPAPAILYVCGHSRAISNGVSFGNKTGYQHHGAWFARNGYVCLLIDTVQYGEILGEHRGTYSENKWWWNSRGYTPAGVEAWFGIRALDYLCTRPEVDLERIGMTGRSGGGAYTWMVAALDDRVKVACPIAGITDLQNHVVDGCVEGHCDCMFFVNTYRWDFPQLAALIAPRPLLLGNSDKDRIFPLDGVLRVHDKVRRIYELLGAQDKLGLLITEGPHADTQDLQVPVFRWFNRFLKGDDQLIELAARKFFDPQQLKVFDQLPGDELNTKIQASFVPPAKALAPDEVRPQQKHLLAKLQAKTFAGWPQADGPLKPAQVFSIVREDLKFSAWDFSSQPEVRLRLYLLERAQDKPAGSVALRVLDSAAWPGWLGAMRAKFADELKLELAETAAPAADSAALKSLTDELIGPRGALAFFAPRGVGFDAWSGAEKRLTQIRRRFMLLGQTLDGMRVWDVRRAVQALHLAREGDAAKVDLRATGAMAGNAALAALFEPDVRELDFKTGRLPEELELDYLGLLRVMDRDTLSELLKFRGLKTGEAH